MTLIRKAYRINADEYGLEKLRGGAKVVMM
jgi:hypothetical protein